MDGRVDCARGGAFPLDLSCDSAKTIRCNRGGCTFDLVGLQPGKLEGIAGGFMPPLLSTGKLDGEITISSEEAMGMTRRFPCWR